MQTTFHSIAFFISPHGFGHAARAAAVMAALRAQDPRLHFEIFTRVPRWFFKDSLDSSFTYHPLLTDIGLVQETALHENIPQTLRQLEAFLPFRRAQVKSLAEQVQRLRCEVVVCDIAPLGIAVARAAGIPSILVENFTWDWIYVGYTRDAAGFRPFIQYLHHVFAQADYHIQTEPVCAHRRVDLVTSPVSREPRTLPREIRRQLEIPIRAKTVLITMGGIPAQHAFVECLADMPRVFFVVPGSAHSMQKRGNVILLPHRSNFFHPDLINACDAVIGKVGYSTVAEAYQAGIPFGYIQRAKFRESNALARFIGKELGGVNIPADEFASGQWLAMLSDLLALPRIKRDQMNGAVQVAEFIATTRKTWVTRASKVL